jgi:hypothetical protein
MGAAAAAGTLAKAPCCGGRVVMAAGAAAKEAPCCGSSVVVMVAGAAISFVTFNTSLFSSPPSSSDGRVSGSIYPFVVRRVVRGRFNLIFGNESNVLNARW